MIKHVDDYPHGYLLKTVLYHCGFELEIRDKLKLFYTSNPFTADDKISFVSRCQIYDFPSMKIYGLARGSV